MNLLIETSLPDLYIGLFNDRFKVVDKIRIPNLTKKTDEFFTHLDTLLINNKIKLANIKKIYVTLGPGSFNGARIGLLFARTIAQLNTKTKMLVAPTFLLYKTQFLLQAKPLNIKIKANKYSVYNIKFEHDKLEKILIKNTGEYDLFNYNLLEDNLKLYLSFFKEISQDELLSVELEYISDPQIGDL